jgi:hypothetical protein
VIVTPVVYVWRRFVPTWEGKVFDFVFGVGLVIIYILVLNSFTKAVVFFQEIRRFLISLAWHPFADAYQRVPRIISRSLQGLLYVKRPKLIELQESIRYAQALVNQLAMSTDRQSLMNEVNAAQKALPDDSKQRRFWADSKAQTHLWTVYEKLMPKLVTYWNAGTEPRRSDFKKKNSSSRTWYDLAEEFAAIHVVHVLRGMLAHLRYYLIFATAGSVLLVAAVVSYPFQPRRLMLIFLSTIIITISISLLGIFTKFNKDEVLSRILRTVPGKLTWDRGFISRIVIYIVLPLLSLLATQFPQVGSFFYSFLDPVQKAFK